MTSAESLEQYCDGDRILLQGRPLEGSNLLTVAVALLSPLRFTDMNAELLLRACECGFPVVPTVCPMSLLERAHAKAEERGADPVSPHPDAVQAAIRDYLVRGYAVLVWNADHPGPGRCAGGGRPQRARRLGRKVASCGKMNSSRPTKTSAVRNG